jgi:transposase InsO family protein
VRTGARRAKACETVGLCAKTLERWRSGKDEDLRCGPKTRSVKKLSDKETKRLLEIANSKEYRDLSPKQIIPMLADKGEFLASESTLYRILRAHGQQQHREKSSAPAKRAKPKAHEATGPNQVWSWDITYLKSPVKGMFFYLYMIVDVWSRKIVGWEVHIEENMELSSLFISEVCREMKVEPEGIVLHSDNGGPMKGATMLATLQKLGIVDSFSRPSVSNDNPYSESLFRTLKYRPEYLSRPFENIDAAKQWVRSFVEWYNTTHLHSGIKFVTPDERHYGRESEILRKRKAVYEEAKRKNTARWTGKTRNLDPVKTVYLNPEDLVQNTSAQTKEGEVLKKDA